MLVSPPSISSGLYASTIAVGLISSILCFATSTLYLSKVL